ncbi:MAG: hypothetical protein N3G75_06785 [Methanothrix sp.]|nr:hypothetical protein [Methanothrix sp.]MCX8207522.1 hypothetical protein [Methanothrix sp.]
MTILVGDLKTNLKLEAGRMTCHGSLDIELTAAGDLAVTETPYESFIQHLIMWLGTPRSEIAGRQAGSILYDYLHEKLTRTTAAELEILLQHDLEESIPEFADQLVLEHVSCQPIPPNRMRIRIQASGQNIDILTGESDLSWLSSVIADAFLT